MENKLQYAVDHSRSRSYGNGVFPDVIPLDFGNDFHLETMPELYAEIQYSGDHKKRRVLLEIDSYVGFCAGAIHYYGTLKADGVHIIQERKDENGKITKSWLGGYICEEFKESKKSAFYSNIYEFEVLRDITQEDIDKDPERWEYYSVGDKTNAFYSPEEVIEQAKKIVKYRFPDWDFEIEDY